MPSDKKTNEPALPMGSVPPSIAGDELHAAFVAIAEISETSPAWEFVKKQLPKPTRDAVLKMHKIQQAFASGV